jgi:hypothetical protein
VLSNQRVLLKKKWQDLERKLSRNIKDSTHVGKESSFVCPRLFVELTTFTATLHIWGGGGGGILVYPEPDEVPYRCDVLKDQAISL